MLYITLLGADFKRQFNLDSFDQQTGPFRNAWMTDVSFDDERGKANE